MNEKPRGLQIGTTSFYQFGDGVITNGYGEVVAELGILATGIFELLLIRNGMTVTYPELLGYSNVDEFLSQTEINRVRSNIWNLRLYLERSEEGLGKKIQSSFGIGYYWDSGSELSSDK